MGLFQAASATSTQTGAETADPAAVRETGAEETDATRHLCTGVYNDRAFRNMVIRKVHNDAAHRSAPSYGFDLVAVTQRAWHAWLLETIEQACLLIVVVIAIALDRNVVVVAACGIGIAYLAWIGLRGAPEMLQLHAEATRERVLKRRGKVADHDRRKESARLFLLCCGGCAALAAFAGVAAQHGRTPLGELVLAAVLLAVLAAISAIARAVRQRIINGIHAGARLRPARLTGRLSIIEAQQVCEYVIYRRPRENAGQEHAPDWYSEPRPFVGSGTLVNRWLPPLSVQLLRPGEGKMSQREYQIPPFKAHELVRYLKDAMGPAGLDPSRLQGFRIADRSYVAETDVMADRSFLQSRCASEVIDKVIDDPYATAQHFLEIQLSTTGELVTTAFVRVTVRGKTLSLDFAACALTRTPEKYHVLDKYRETGTGAVLRAALRGVYGIPVSVGGLWRLVEVPWILARAVWARKDRTLVPRRRRTIGTRVSIREEKATAWDEAELDHTVIYDDVKIIEQRVLKATEDFLESKEVDTSLFKRRVFNIISAGILNMGKLDMNQTAIGTNAQININNQAPGGGAGTGNAAGGEGT